MSTNFAYKTPNFEPHPQVHISKNPNAGADPQVGDFRVVVTEQPLQDGEVRYFTYMKYKGCESKIVILLDVDDNDPRWNDRGIYTAMSRAVHELIILRSN